MSEQNFTVGCDCYVVKYALTIGIMKEVVRVFDDSGYYIVVENNNSCFVKSKEVFLTLEEAQKQAENMRLAKIKSHQKSIAKLEKLKFD